MSDTPLPTLDELRDELRECDSWEEQCALLMEFGEELPDLPAAEKVEANRVHGCQSRVWLVSQLTGANGDARLHVKAKSDARFVDGLIVVLLSLFDGKSPHQVLATDAKQVFSELGLEGQLVPQRKNGLYAMVERVRALAATATATSKKPDTPATPRVRSEIPILAPAAQERTAADVDWAAVRAQFPILAQTNDAGRPIIYLDSASSAQKPRGVIDRERVVYETFYANAYRGVYRFGDRVSRELEATRERVQRFIGAERPEEVVFTSGTTMSINLVANAWGRKFLKPGDELLITEMEHHANWAPWRWIADQTGAKLVTLRLADDGQLDLSRLDEQLTERTKLTAISGMSNVLGTCPPLKRIVARAKQVGSLVLVDGAQSVPHLPVQVAREGIDFLAFSGHKLYGPSGVGVLYGRYELLDSMDPFLCGGHMIRTAEESSWSWNSPPAKFEAGTPAIAQIIALGSAIDFVSDLGLCAIHGYEQSLLRRCHQRLAAIAGVTILGPAPQHKGAIVSFTVDGVGAEDVARLLDVKGLCVRHGHHCTMPLHRRLGIPASTRASFGVYNTLSDVDAFADALTEIAARGEGRAGR